MNTTVLRTFALCINRLVRARDVRKLLMRTARLALHNQFDDDTHELRTERVTAFLGRRRGHFRQWNRAMKQLYRIVEFPPDPEDQEMRLFRVVDAPILSKTVHFTWSYYYPAHDYLPHGECYRRF